MVVWGGGGRWKTFLIVNPITHYEFALPLSSYSEMFAFSSTGEEFIFFRARFVFKTLC